MSAVASNVAFFIVAGMLLNLSWRFLAKTFKVMWLPTLVAGGAVIAGALWFLIRPKQAAYVLFTVIMSLYGIAGIINHYTGAQNTQISQSAQ